MAAKSILLVDDEIKVLNSLTRTLSEANYDDIKTAPDGMDAMAILKSTPDIAVIVSDYNMPGLNGIELLKMVHQNFPDVTRILLTGAADLDMAIEAINQGSIFRFLLKPCSPLNFKAAIKDGLRQNELIIAERELLSKTLSGSIKVLIDILSLLSPGIFAQASRLRNLARKLASSLHIEDQAWEIEVAALLSQVGAVTMPRDILERWHKGELLEEPEAKMIRTIPRLGKLLIKNIPRLEKIAEAVGYQNCTFSGQASIDAPTGEMIPLMARILKIIIDYDRLVEKAYNPSLAFQTMLIHESDYDPNILAAFRLTVLRSDIQSSYPITHALRGEKEINIDGIKLGMVLSRDVVDKNNILIVSKGTMITDVLMYQLINYFRSQALSEPVYVESAF